MVASKHRHPPRIVHWIQQSAVQHVLFWLAAWLVLMLPGLIVGNDVFRTLVSEFINLLFYAAMVYINLLFLIPTYLRAQKTGWYVGSLMGWAIILMPLKVMALYLWKNTGNQQQQPEDQGNALLSILVVALGSTVVQIITDWIRGQQERRELEQRNIESELNFLKTQINPHFLFNTLNTLYALTLRKSDKAPEIVIKLSEMMRYMLYDCNEIQVPLAKEIGYLRNYLDLEKLRHAEKVDIHFDVHGDMNGQLIAPLMFIPFLENSFKHGLSNALTKGYVASQIDIAEDHIELIVENSKPERLPAREGAPRSGGIGLTNVRRRLALLYPDAHSLEVEDTPDTYRIRLVINKIKERENNNLLVLGRQF